MAKTVLLFAAACLVGTGCDSKHQDTVESPPHVSPQGLSIELHTVPDPPRSGDNIVEVMIKDSGGSPITDATVSAVFSMPPMPSMNMPEMHGTLALTHQGNGRYRGTGQLSMAGTWNVALRISRGDGQISVDRFVVIAK